MKPRWKWMGALLTVAAVAAIAGGYFYQHHKRYKHFAVHVPGKVYRSAWVDAEVFAELIPEYHVKTVVNLCYPGEMGNRNVDQRAAVEGAGAKVIDLPFPPNDTWDVNYPSVAEMERILDDPASYPIWIHCQHGRERTVSSDATSSEVGRASHDAQRWTSRTTSATFSLIPGKVNWPS